MTNFTKLILESPTNPLTIFELQDQDIGEFYQAQARRATDFEAPILWKSSSGTSKSLPKFSGFVFFSVAYLS